MKPWDHYRNNPHPYPNRHEYSQQLRTEINEAPMTAKEREAALADVPRRTNEWFNEAVKPHNAYAAERDAEFWADCRADLGYDEFLTPEGCSILEHQAYEDGHSAGYSEIYGCLMGLTDLARKLVQHKKG